MNRIKANTEAAPAAMPFDYEKAFESFESPITVALCRGRVVAELIAKVDRRAPSNGFHSVAEGEFEAILFMAGEVNAVLRDLDELWLSHHNASVCIEREIDLARRAS